MRRKPRIDGNHREIVDALEAVGASVQSLAAVGSGCPDLLAALRGRNFLFEIKDGSKPPSERTLTPDQKRWINAWQGDVRIITSVDEAIQAVTGGR